MTYLRTIQAHFDGVAFVPDEKVDLPVGIASQVTVEVEGLPLPVMPLTADEISHRRAALRDLRTKLAGVAPVPFDLIRRTNLYGDDGRLQ
jgi:hypothetical protein